MVLPDQWLRDLRDGLRALTRRPGFSAVAILSLAVGIGANTAIFTLVNAVILRPTPLERPEELVKLYMHSPTFRFGSLSYPDYEDVKDGTREVFSEIGGTQFSPIQVDTDGGVDVLFGESLLPSCRPCLGLTACLAAYLPARRAARLNPLTALRVK